VEDLSFDYTKASPVSFMEYMIKVMKRIRISDVEKSLVEKFLKARKKARIKRRLSDDGVVKLKAYIIPHDIEVESKYGIPIKIKIANNSGLKIINGRRLGLFMRLGPLGGYLLGEWKCRTFLAYTEIDYEIRGRIKVRARPIMVPLNSCECIEDPRIDPDDAKVMYHVRGYYIIWPSKLTEMLENQMEIILTFKTVLSEENDVLKIEPLMFMDRNGDVFLLRHYRDSFPLTSKYMTIRPILLELGTGGVFVAPRQDNVVPFDELEPVPDLLPQEREKKVGGNVSVKISSNEYLLIYHAVEEYFGGYYTYAALFSEDGEYLGSTVEPIIPVSPDMYPGCRPTTIFVCGVVKVGDELIISAGKDDEIIVLYECEVDDIVERMRFVKG